MVLRPELHVPHPPRMRSGWRVLVMDLDFMAHPTAGAGFCWVPSFVVWICLMGALFECY